MVLGFAESESVGNGVATVTLTDSVALPPAPLQVRLKLLFEIKALMVWEPDVALSPDQSPEAVQSVVLVVFQLRVVVPLEGKFEGLADKLTVGRPKGAATVTLTESLALPPAPLQVMLKVLSAVSVPVVCEPAVARLPDQSPEAVQSLLLPLFQFKIAEPS